MDEQVKKTSVEDALNKHLGVSGTIYKTALQKEDDRAL